MWVKICTPARECHIVDTNCALVPKANALDVDISGCEMWIECMGTWIDRCSV